MQIATDTDSNTQIQQIFNQQLEKYKKSNAFSYKERLESLKKLEKFLMDDQKMKPLLDALKVDLGKSEAECYATEIGIVLVNVRYIKSQLKKWMRPKFQSTPLMLTGTTSSIKYEPRGVCLIMSPWNYPFNLCITPLIYSIAAGNRNIIKPSEMAPHTSQFIQDMVNELFSEDYVSVIQGEVETATQLLSLPFHHIFFTGSPKIGSIVMEKAAKNLTTVVLELGGKSPAIFEKGTKFNKYVPRLVWGKCINAGQTCIAPDYIFIHNDDKEEFISSFKEKLAIYYGKGIDMSETGDYCKIINERHFHRIIHLLEDAVNKGAKVVHGGIHDISKRFIEPTLLDNISPDMEIYKEEIFGPLLPIVTYIEPEDIIQHVNSGEKPLSLYICGSNSKFQNQIIDNTSSGGVVINDFLLGYSNPDLPFGGVNNSGNGRSLGQEGFIGFSNPKSIVKRRFLDFRMIFPPYTNGITKLIKGIMKKL